MTVTTQRQKAIAAFEEAQRIARERGDEPIALIAEGLLAMMKTLKSDIAELKRS